jgi:hypothetical protein
MTAPRRIWTDADWREPGTRLPGWRPLLNAYEANSRAALLDRAPATTFADAARMTTAPTWNRITKHGRAILAGIKTYLENVK